MGVEIIIKKTGLPSLTTLRLYYNNIGTGAKSILYSLANNQLKFTNLD